MYICLDYCSINITGGPLSTFIFQQTVVVEAMSFLDSRVFETNSQTSKVIKKLSFMVDSTREWSLDVGKNSNIWKILILQWDICIWKFFKNFNFLYMKPF